MNSNQALYTHQLIMAQYTQTLNIHLEYKKFESLDNFKETIAEIAQYTAPTGVHGKTADFLDSTAVDKIDAATKAACDIAMSHVNKIDNLNDIDECAKQFKNAFALILKVELYRQYFAHCQENQKRIVLDCALKKRNTNLYDKNEITRSDILDFIHTSVKTMIASDVERFQVETGTTPEFVSFKTEISALKSDFKKQILSLQNKQDNKLDEPAALKMAQNAALNFEIKAQLLIQSYQIKYEHDEQWAPFLKNLALNLALIATGIGALVSIGLLIYRGVTNKHAFFDNPILRRVPEEERGLNKLVSEQDLNDYSELLADSKENITSLTI